jgi:hypothetical protein
MIVCSCTVITHADIEQALIELLSQDNAPLPTPGVVFRHIGKKMNCCGCAPLTVSTIYETMERLEREGRVCPCACATARSKLLRIVESHKTRRNGTGGAQEPLEIAGDLFEPVS